MRYNSVTLISRCAMPRSPLTLHSAGTLRPRCSSGGAGRRVGSRLGETMAVRFDDGAAYERMMGIWSRRVGEDFLGWLNLPPGLKCIDVGCGTAHSPNCWSSVAGRLKFRGLIRRLNRSSSPANGTPQKSRNSAKATRWRFHSPTADLIPPQWLWSSSLFRSRPKVLPDGPCG